MAEEGEDWKEVAATPLPGAAGVSNTAGPVTSGIKISCFLNLRYKHQLLQNLWLKYQRFSRNLREKYQRCSRNLRYINIKISLYVGIAPLSQITYNAIVSVMKLLSNPANSLYI